MTESIVLSLIQNTAILLSFSMLYDYLWIRKEKTKLWYVKVITGLIVGFIGLVLMLTPWMLSPGLFFDTRTILLSISGLFLGAIPTLVAMVVTGSYRFLLGGDGLWMGLASIVSSGTIGILWGKLRPNWRSKKPLWELMAMGAVVHLVMVSSTFLLPQGQTLSTLKVVYLPLVFIYSPGVMLLGMLMLHRIANWKNKKALYETQVLYASLVENMPAGVYRKTKEGRYEYVNARFCSLRGLKEDDIIGKTPAELAEVSTITSRQRSLVAQATENHEWIVRNGKTIEEEESYPQEDGSVDYFQVVKTPIFDIDGQVVGSQGMQFDITLQKKLQSELMVAKNKAEDSDRLKTAFLHNISHEIRTPMNAIIGFSNLLNDPDLSTEKRNSYTEVIVQSGNQLLSIIDDIVRVATIEAGQEKINEGDFQINSSCLLLYNQFLGKSKEAGVDFQLKLGLQDVDAWILSDEVKILEVVSNLLANAFKFTEKGHVYLGYTLKDHLLEFYVEDTGIGIPDEMHENIFKRFRQVDSTISRTFGGSGLGLSICRAYIELLGGKMWVKSQLGSGSTFYFTLPYKKSVMFNGVGASSLFNDQFDGKTYHILVAEDEILNFRLLEEMLLPLNVRLLWVENGAEAVELISAGKSVDLVLMDLKMPVMDGFEAAKRIKGAFPLLPIIALSAYSCESDKEKALACGCCDFICKPFQKTELIEKIGSLLFKD